jgi:hypothetical protein
LLGRRRAAGGEHRLLEVLIARTIEDALDPETRTLRASDAITGAPLAA